MSRHNSVNIYLQELGIFFLNSGWCVLKIPLIKKRFRATLKKSSHEVLRSALNCDRLYSHIDDAINDAYLLSDLRKPSQITTQTDEDGQTQKKSRYKKLSPILFVKIQHSTGKKNRQSKNKLVKALVDTGASESIISLKAAKGLPLSNRTETKNWSTAAGLLKTSSKTKRLEFSLTELQASRKIEKSFHVVDIDLKNYEMIIGRDLITSLQLDIKGSDMSIK